MATSVAPTAAPYNDSYGNEPGRGPLRQTGQSFSDLPSTASNLPSVPSASAKKQQPAVELVRDCWGGTGAIRDRSTVYLPQAPGEKTANYQVRLLRSVFTNFFRRTVELLVGFVFRKDPVLGDDVPPIIREQWENIDNAGTHGDVFIRDSLQDAMTAGHAAILVEYPATGGRQNPREERTGAVRPYWVPIHKENILSWRVTVENGKTVLRQLVLKECTMVDDGAFGEKEQERYRVLYRIPGETPTVGFALLGVNDMKKVFVEREGIYTNQTEIPVAEIVTSGRKAILESDPPFLDLAYLNVAHYQQWSDYATSIYRTCVPVLFTSGFSLKGDSGEEIIVGPNNGLNSDNPDADAKYVAHDGAALGSCRQALEDLVRDMASLGVAALASEKRAAETEGAKRMDKGATDSALAVTARGLQDGVERSLQFHANYLRLPSGGSITINRDFDSMVMEPDVMNAFAQLAESGFPKEEVVKALKAGGRLSDDADIDAIVMAWQGEEDAKRELADQENMSRAAALFGSRPPEREAA
jgi:hypothetical protein